MVGYGFAGLYRSVGFCVPGTIQIQERQRFVEKIRGSSELEVPCKRDMDVVNQVRHSFFTEDFILFTVL